MVATANDAYLSFAPQTLGTTSVAAPVTITNTGSATLLVSSASITTGASDFATSGSCASIVPAATCTLLITFSPSTASALSGLLTISTNAGIKTVTLAGSGVATSGIKPPDAPIIGIPSAALGQITIAFSAPVNDGGAAITGYEVLCNPGAITLATATASPVTFMGLTNNQTYTCFVTATNSAGTSNPSASVTVTPSSVTLVSVKSRKVHGTAGTFDLTIDTSKTINQAITIEPRNSGPGHLLVFQFAQTITQLGGVAVTDATAANVDAGYYVLSGNTVLVALVGVSDAKRVTVMLTGVNGTPINVQAAMGFLAGDVNGSRSINAGDIAAIKARNGQAVDATTSKFDLNTSGTINAQDVSIVKSRAGMVLP